MRRIDLLRRARPILAGYGLIALLLPARLAVDTPAFHVVLSAGYVSFALALLFGLAGVYRLATGRTVHSYRLCMARLLAPVLTPLLLRLHALTP